ncbi:Amino acid transporter, transmembrane [Salix suchowensis]|nr:Amino acid transporter, transmembrane [Salix suchowensis]
MGTQVPGDQNPDVPEEFSEADRRKKEIDDWLPITSSRNAKWWYSAFHNVTAMVGAGGPWYCNSCASWAITLYTLWQMVEMHEMVPGKRFDRYHELGQHAFGEKLGLYIVVPQQLICEVGVDIVYMVTGGKSLQKIHNLVCKDCAPIKLTYFIMIFASVHFVLSHLPNFNSISGVSLAAAVMSLSFCPQRCQPDVEYGYKASTTSGTVFNFLSALGDVAFAYAGHNVVLEIQATIPSKPGKPSKGQCGKEYYMFGNKVEDNILISLEKPTWLIVAANMFVVIHVMEAIRFDLMQFIISHEQFKHSNIKTDINCRAFFPDILVSAVQQIYAIPVFDMLETLLVKKLHFRPSRKLRFITRNLYVAATMFVGICFPFFGGLLGFFGGFAFAPTTYFLPCIMWLAIYKPKRFSLSWITNWICITLGFLLMILSPIGGLRNIILSAKGYNFSPDQNSYTNPCKFRELYVAVLKIRCL